jgi:YD repeat-containing protein
LHSDLNVSSTKNVLADGDALRGDVGVMSRYLPANSFNLFISPVPQGGSSKIVFASNREGSMQIYVMNSDGSGVTRLTYSGANDDYPRWSPNGAKILFESDRDHPDTGYMDIYVMNSDGGGVTRLTTDANDDSMASWSGDGSKIVFQSMRNGVNYQVYSMNADGSNQVNLTNTASSDGEPSWSPDGSKIAFASDRDHAAFDSVYVMNSNGTNEHRITFSGDTVDDTQPVWSNDGGKIAFVSTRDSTTETWQETDDDGNYITKSKLRINKEVYVMNADGSGQLRLTNDLANDDAPSWSPDGAKIVWRTDRERDCCDPSAQVWTMNADGSNQVDVSNNGNGDYVASWTSGSGNQLPIANVGGTYSGILSQNVPFHGGSSYDPDGTIVSYSWNFGDGGSSPSAAPTHAYTTIGTYTATLTVTDNLGAQGSASTTVTISASSSDQYSVNFLQAGLGRLLIGNEGTYWTDIMRAAYLQGQPSMLMAMTEFGMTVFESAEYMGRSRSDHDYVYDLYETYLMRYPDQDGWDYWTTQASPLHMGRGQVRNAFEESPEFHNIVATLAASGNPSSAAASLSTARVDPFNQGVDQVQARDCQFGIPLASLPGRAGLDLGLSLSYSSLVWTQSGPYVYFDPDNEGMSPGFTIGFPTIQWRSFDAQTARNVYLMTAGGRRIELRQLGNSNVYESYDSSYLQLIDYGSSLTLKTTDGTQIGFGAFANGWHATGVEDRNGNVVTINNYWWGEIHTITDTLGRILTFNYDGSSNLTSITQSWSGQQQPHTWVTFGWGTATLHPSFSSEVVGTVDNENIPVLTMVGFPDGSYTKFGYSSYGQVSQLTHYASDSNPLTDNHPLNTTVYNYGPAGFDCPRLSEQRVSAENWTSVNGLPPYALTQFSDPGDGSRQMITADNTTYKEFFGTGWQHGLVTSTQVIAASTVQKSTTTSYVQDDTSVNYQTNPRAIASDVSDGTNHKLTTIGYATFSLPSGTSCSLPNDVYEYDADQTTVLRRNHTDYNLDSNYLNKRIIGLPQARLLYQGVSALMSKTTYVYDWGGEYLEGLPAIPTQHDASYSSDIWLGRGNLVDVVRWDTTDPDNSSKAWETKTAYNIDGSILFTRDPLGHQTSMGYADSFSDGNNSRNTFAYPTTLTDPDGGQSFIQYNYDFGAKTRFEGPPPQDKPNGIIQTFAYDDAIRVRQVTTTHNGAYSSYLYGPTNVVMLSSINVIGDEAYTNTAFDGLGRSLGVATNNPGSTGGYKAQLTQYDIMGRAIVVQLDRYRAPQDLGRELLVETARFLLARHRLLQSN